MQPLALPKIASFLSKNYQHLIKQTIIFDSLPSTNTYLLERARAQDKNILLCLAEYQSMGRGRFQRQWLSSAQRNICLSARWSCALNTTECSALSLVVAVAVVRALKKIGVTEELGLKWPNDIQWHGKKLAGILIEICHDSEKHAEFVIGIGVNVSQSAQIKESLSFAITDLYEITGVSFDRNQLVAYIIECLFAALTEFTQHRLTVFLEEWLAYDVALNQSVTLLMNEKRIDGIYRGIDRSSGALLLEDESGALKTYLSGEISLRIDRA